MTPRPVAHPPAPGTPEWRRMITASKIPAMLRDSDGEFLGIGYESAYELYHQMTGDWDGPDLDQEMLENGHDMEPSGRAKWKRAHPDWWASEGEKVYADDELPFPNQVTLDVRVGRGSRRGIVEVKAPFKDDGVHDNWRAQVTFQMGVTGWRDAWIVLMPTYGKARIERIEWDPDLYAAIVDDAAAFWRLLEAGTPPDAAASEHAAQILAALHPTPDREADTVLDQDVMDDLLTAWDRLAEAKGAAQMAENRVMDAMGDTGKATFDDRKVAGRIAGKFSQKRFPEPDILADYQVPTTKLDTAKLKADHPDLYAQAVGNPSFIFERKAWT